MPDEWTEANEPFGAPDVDSPIQLLTQLAY